MDSKLYKYQAGETLSKTGPELVVKVYEGALNCLRRAIEQYNKNNRPAGYESLEQSKKFIVHLYTTLDVEKGGEIATQLSRLYVFLIEQINMVQATGNMSLVDDLLEVLGNLRDGWAQLAEQQSGKLSKTKEQNITAQKTLSISV